MTQIDFVPSTPAQPVIHRALPLRPVGQSVGHRVIDLRPRPTITAVIPTRNEADSLPAVLAAVRPFVDEIVIVDGASTDSTMDVARELCPEAIVFSQSGRGKGNALREGFRAATSDIIVMMDADGSTDPNEIPRFVAALESGADFAKGSRHILGGGSADFTRTRAFGNRVFTIAVNVLWRAKYSDLCYGYNAFWRALLNDVVVDCNGFEVETLLNIRVLAAGKKIVEVPSFELLRTAGESKLSAWRDGVRVLRTIVAERIRPQ